MALLQKKLLVLHLEEQVLDDLVKKPLEGLLGKDAGLDFLGHFGHQLAVAFKAAEHRPEQRLLLRQKKLPYPLVRGWPDLAHHAGPFHVRLHQGGAVNALHHDADGVLFRVEKLDDLGHHAHFIEVLLLGVLHGVVPLGHQENLAVALHGLFDGQDGFFPAHVKVQQHGGEHDDPPHGNGRQCNGGGRPDRNGFIFSAHSDTLLYVKLESAELSPRSLLYGASIDHSRPYL